MCIIYHFTFPWEYKIYYKSVGWCICWFAKSKFKPLQWRHNERNGVSNHLHLGCLLNRLFRCRSKKTSKFRVTVLCERKPPYRWIPLTTGQLSGECLHLMTSSCWSRPQLTFGVVKIYILLFWMVARSSKSYLKWIFMDTSFVNVQSPLPADSLAPVSEKPSTDR